MNPIVMDDVWLTQAATTVGSQGVAHALIQGYPFTCFARIGPNGLELPPVFSGPPDWKQFFDVRVFDAHGEWHAWRIGARWYDRRYISNSWPDFMEREYAMWGTERVQNVPAGWECLVETRGARVWIPSGLAGASLPAKLTMKLRVGQDPKTGIAGIEDAAITGVK